MSANNTVLYGITVLIWGSTWFAIDHQLGVVSPEVSVFYRYAAAALLLLAWIALRGGRLRFSLSDHLRFAILGCCLFGFNFILAYSAQQYISSAMTAVAFSTMLWMNIINARLLFGTPIDVRVAAGSVIGIAGLAMLFAPEISSLSTGDATLAGAALAISSALIASFGNMASQAMQKRKLPVLQANAWGMLYGAVITGLYAYAKGSEFIVDPSFSYWASMLYLVVFGSIVAFGAYLTLLGRIGAHKASYAVVMFPVVAILLSLLFEDLKITGNLIAGVALILLGNIITLGRVGGVGRRRRYLAEGPPCQARNRQPSADLTSTSV